MTHDTIDVRRARRELLERLLPEVDARRQRRTLRRAAVALAITALAAWGWSLRDGRTERAVRDAPVVAGERSPAPAPPRAVVLRVADDPGLLARCRVDARADRVVRIDDEELRDWLLRCGHATGYVRSRDRFALVRPLGE